MKENVVTSFSKGQSKRFSIKLKYCTFILLKVLKQRIKWEFLAKVFNCKGPNFEPVTLRFCSEISPSLYKNLVTVAEKTLTHNYLHRQIHKCTNHPSAWYAMDFCFQHSYRKLGSMREDHPWYPGKHKPYGFKFEASELPSGLCIWCSLHAPGGRSDLEILQSRIIIHKDLSGKLGDKDDIEHCGEGFEKFNDLGAMLIDKGYQGVRELLRGIHPIRNPINCVLST